MKNLQIILHENVERFGENGEILPDKVSTLGYKFDFEGEWYGEYFVINKPSVTVQDVMETLKQLCPIIEQTLEKLQSDTKSI